MKKYDDIIRKIKGLLATANGKANEDEAQAAFALAQKLMIKHNIESSEIDRNDDENILEEQLGDFGVLKWHERQIANIISSSFRVKCYYGGRKVNGKTARAVRFFGLENDVFLAKEMYVLALDAMEYHYKKYINDFWGAKKRSRTVTTQIKNSYMIGFINALYQKMKKQKEDLEEEFGLVVLTPKIVQEKYDLKAKDFKNCRPCKIPNANVSEAYVKGYDTGSNIDYSKSTIDS